MKETLFLNFNNMFGLSVNTYRNTATSCGNDIIEFCRDVQLDIDSNVTLDDIDAQLDLIYDALSEGIAQEVIEHVTDFLTEFKNNQN